jgi:hypothetical protein
VFYRPLDQATNQLRVDRYPLLYPTVRRQVLNEWELRATRTAQPHDQPWPDTPTVRTSSGVSVAELPPVGKLR